MRVAFLCREKSILDGHRFRVHCLFAGDAFQPGQNATIIILVTLNCEATFLVAVGPCQSDEMLLGFAERCQRSQSKREYADRYRSANSAVNILPVTHLRDRGGGNGCYISSVFEKPYLISIDVQFQTCPRFDVG